MTELSADALRLLIAHVEKHWKRCSACGAQTWSTTAYSILPLTSDPNDFSHTENGLPCVPVVCDTCGNTILVNAFVAGLLPRPPRQP